MLTNGDISKLAYENSVLNVNSAKANHLSAKANLSMMEKTYQDTRIMSPIRGLVSRKYIELGTMVNPNMAVYRVIDLSTLKIEVGISQTMISKVKTGSEAIITISSLRNNKFAGKVHYLSPQADEGTGAYTAEIHVKNTTDMQIKAGMTAKIDLTVSDNGEQLAIPDYALIPKDAKNYVYKIKNGTARLTEIEILEGFASQLIIGNGIAEGDTIVVVGMKNLGIDTKVWIETIH